MSKKSYLAQHKVTVVLMLTILFSSTAYISVQNSWFAQNSEFEQKITMLEEKIFLHNELAEGNLKIESLDSRAKYIVFISVCNTQNRATVIHSTGKTLKSAWDSAVGETRKFINDNDYNAVWVKADVVTQVDKIKSQDFGEQIKNLYNDFFRKGIAFDNSFNTALLEAELSGSKMINYDDNLIEINAVNKYLESNNRSALKGIPDDLYLFRCKGFICDDTDKVYELYSNDMDYGRRKVDVVDKAVVKELIYNSSQFLVSLVLDDGKFIYGYHPRFDNELTGYNILRHSGTIWALINQYKTTGDEKLIPKIESTINYLIEDAVVYKNEETAYIAEKAAAEIKLGGNAVAVITLIDYMEEFKTDKYKDLVIKLGNGILELQDQQNGSYFHVLNYPDLSKKAAYRTVYYDGEATFALAKLYGFDQNEKWLNAAKRAVDYFIAEDYTVHRDHWVAYSLNEVTKYAPEEKYFEFALRNVQKNLDVIYQQKTSYHTYLELLMISFELYDRIMTEDIPVAYLENFNEEQFIKTIFHRARHQLNGYLYPEYAMYLENPSRVVNTFCVRHDGYRVRIDDVQHFIGGYYYYYLYYDRLQEYKNSAN